ncbi:hypothetical protein E3N88_36860 [Mikania micrantha]|uniref:tRNA (guanine(46)-N(7))-methyltransferase n=1 Tax=Mikania micrantha TaxID=192012 RepID=A0A5N6M4U4_9ASTR|nr:hypothetical protein E3N88_36860 [Mikania micrantha]
MANAIIKIPLFSTLTTLNAVKASLNSPLIHGYVRHICNCSSAASVSQQQQRQPQIRSPQLVALEYADLSIPHIVCEELGALRVRQHVNPLSSCLSVPVEVPNWEDVFENPKLPLVVDIGSGSGRFLMWLAKKNPGSKNYMGLEIRKKLVTRAEKWAKELALSNIHFLFANASISFKQLIATYPGPLMLVSVLCPDPHFKKRHHKRRIVQKPLVDAIVDGLMPGGQLAIYISPTMGGGYKHHGACYPPHVSYPNHGYPYPPPAGYPPVGYPHHVYPPPGAGGYPCYPGHGGHKHGMGTFLAGGAAAVAAAYGAHHMPHHGYGSHGYGYYGHHHHHGKFKHYKFKRAKFGKRWKHGGMFGKHKMWK